MKQSLRQRLAHCTLTGIDQGVPFDALYEIHRRHPFVEFGVLYSSKQAGSGRYPSLGCIRELTRAFQHRPGPKFSLHICGTAVGQFIDGLGDVTEVAQAFPRIQLNFRWSDYSLPSLRRMLDDQFDKVVITQHNRANAMLWRSLTDKPNHAVLFDSSGGNGVAPNEFAEPLSYSQMGFPYAGYDPLCGYAGGMRPDNVGELLGKVAQVTNGQPFWIDMETGLRDAQDSFCLAAAQQCVDAVESVLLSDEAARRAHSIMLR